MRTFLVVSAFAILIGCAGTPEQTEPTAESQPHSVLIRAIVECRVDFPEGRKGEPDYIRAEDVRSCTGAAFAE